MDITSIVGVLAGAGTTIANAPQAVKTWRTRETQDLSVWMLAMLSSSLILWVVYGFMRGDWFIIVANAVSAALVASILFVKLTNRD